MTMKKQLLIFLSFIVATTLYAQDSLQIEKKFLQAHKDTLAQRMMLNLFLMKNSKNCSIEEFAQLALGNKYKQYFPPSTKVLKASYLKKFRESADFAAFKKEKLELFEKDAVYLKSYNRSTVHLFNSFANMGIDALQTIAILLETLKINKLYATYTIFEEIFSKK
jgi:hypothetical protein